MSKKRIAERSYLLLVIAAITVHACASMPAPTPTPALTPTETLTPAPTTVPLAWNQVWDGQEIARDPITAIAINPQDPAEIYAGTIYSGLYKSVDGGTSWQPIQNGMSWASGTSLAFDPQNPNIFYARFDEGLYQTTDGGGSWESAENTFGKDIFQCGDRVVQADPHGHGKMYFGNCIFVRDGSEWKLVRGPDGCPRGSPSIAIHPSDENILLKSQEFPSEGCAAGLYLSEDGGQTWTLLHSWEERGPAVVSWQIDSQGGDEIYANVGGFLYVSPDRGQTWKLVNTYYLKGIAPTTSGYMLIYCADTLFKVMDLGTYQERLSDPALGSFHTIVISPQDPNVIYLGGESLLVSKDGGRTWAEPGNGIGAGLIDLELAPRDSSTLYAERFYQDWEFIMGSIPLYRSSDSGHTWELSTDSGLFLALDADGQTLYRYYRDIVDEGSILRSSDRGETWQKLPPPPSLRKFAEIVAHPSIPGKLYTTVDEYNEYFRVSLDRGGSWRTVDWSPVEQNLDASFELVIHPGQDQQAQMFLFLNEGNSIYRSMDEGINWSLCGSTWGVTRSSTRPRTRLGIDPRDSSHLYFATGDGLYASTDGCQSWEKLTVGMENQSFNSLAIDPNTPDTIYAGTEGGAYVSFDGGQTWSQLNEGLLGVTVVYSIVVDKDSNVYAATPYGIFKLDGR